MQILSHPRESPVDFLRLCGLNDCAMTLETNAGPIMWFVDITTDEQAC